MTNNRKQRNQRRSGFTLVEMLVSSALIIFVMVILAQIFTGGLSALRNLRSVNHLQEHLRSASNIMRRDLAAPHFGRETDGLHGPHLSQQRLDLYDWTPPKEGFFRIYQGWTGVDTLEDVNFDNVRDPRTDRDSDGLLSYRSFNHYLHFTVRLEPNATQGSGRDLNFATNSFANAGLAGNVAGLSKPDYLTTDNLFRSRWAEVAYFLRESGQSAGAAKLYTLYRRQRVLTDSKTVVPPLTVTNVPTALRALPDVSAYAANLTGTTISLNTPRDVAAPFRRLGMRVPTTANLPVEAAGLSSAVWPGQAQTFASLFESDASAAGAGGDDNLLENVLSFDIKVQWEIPVDPRVNVYYVGTTPNRKVEPATAFGTTGYLNSEFPFDDLPPMPSPPFVPANVGRSNVIASNGNGFISKSRVFDTWCGEDVLIDPANPALGRVLYSQWNQRYEKGVTPGTPATLAPVTIPLRIRVKAIQIRLRVWDLKTQQARQVTIVQDL